MSALDSHIGLCSMLHFARFKFFLENNMHVNHEIGQFNKRGATHLEVLHGNSLQVGDLSVWPLDIGLSALEC